jgi:uncharacterized protein YjeT (DUF2065 family)
MAIEPYRPQPSPSDKEKAFDQQLERLFDRWRYKLMRAIRWIAIGIAVIWILSMIIPSAWTFLTTQDIGRPATALRHHGHLAGFIGFQFVMMYSFMRTRIYWVRPGETGVSFADYRGNPEVLEAARRIVTLLKGAKQFKQMGGEITRGVLLICRQEQAKATWRKLFRPKLASHLVTSVPRHSPRHLWVWGASKS